MPLQACNGTALLLPFYQCLFAECGYWVHRLTWQLAKTFCISLRSLLFNQCRLQNDSPCRSTCRFFPLYLDTNRFQIVHSTVYPLLFWSSSFPFPPRSSTNTFFTILLSDILTAWPVHSILLSFIIGRVFGFLYITFNLSSFQFSRYFDILLGHIFFLVFSPPMFHGLISFAVLLPKFHKRVSVYYFNACTLNLLLFCIMTNKCTTISQIITLLRVSTLWCHPQGACEQYLAKLHNYIKCSCW